MATIIKPINCIVYTRKTNKEISIKNFNLHLKVMESKDCLFSLSLETEELNRYLNSIYSFKNLYEELSIKFEDEEVLTFNCQGNDNDNNNNKQH